MDPLPFPPPETLVSSDFLNPPPLALHSCFLWSFAPQIQQRAFLSGMLSQLWSHLHCLPALQPVSVLNHLQGTSAVLPRPFPVELPSEEGLAPLLMSLASNALIFNGVVEVVVEEVDVIKTNVSDSANKHWLKSHTDSGVGSSSTRSADLLWANRNAAWLSSRATCWTPPSNARSRRVPSGKDAPTSLALPKCRLQLLNAVDNSAIDDVFGSWVSSFRIRDFSPGPPGWYLMYKRYKIAVLVSCRSVTSICWRSGAMALRSKCTPRCSVLP